MPLARLLLLTLILATVTTGEAGAARPGGWARIAGLWAGAPAQLRAGGAFQPRYPGAPWALSVTVGMEPGGALELADPGRGVVARLTARPDGRVAVTTGATGADAVLPRPIAARAEEHRIELASGPRPVLAVDGRAIPLRGSPRAPALRATGTAPVRLTAPLVTRSRAREALLLHRVGTLSAMTPPHRFPLGEPDGAAPGALRFDGGWTSGFWAGTLWGAATLAPGGPYDRWARAATADRLPRPDSMTHDLGFMFGRSVLRAYRRSCPAPGPPRAPSCATLRATALVAARTLVRLAATNAAGTIPTDARTPQAETIIDSLMNLDLLLWAGRETGDGSFTELARRHAHRVERELLRPDGSTIQAVRFDRSTGEVLGHDTRQGVSANSTWSRGQAWAIYGFAQTGRALRDPELLAAAERAAAWWMRHAPAGAPPPYDFSAPPGAPRDSGAAYDFSAPPGAPRDSGAAMIAAAGLFRLADACAAIPGACASPGRWRGAASRALDAGLRAVSPVPPLGRLGQQAYRVGPRGGAWDDRAELIWGLDFALEAIARRAGRPAPG
jgi:unsaturated chondroitin disaccharide hydrolase